MAHFTLTPAYGRDYTSKAAVLRDWMSEKDFLCEATPQGLAPRALPINRQQLADGDAVHIRYKRNTQVAVFTKGKEKA